MVNSAILRRAFLQHPPVYAHDVRAADLSGIGGGERAIFGGKDAKNNLCVVIEFRIKHFCLERPAYPINFSFMKAFLRNALVFCGDPITWGRHLTEISLDAAS